MVEIKVMLKEIHDPKKQTPLSDEEHITAFDTFVIGLVPNDCFSSSAGFRIHTIDF